MIFFILPFCNFVVLSVQQLSLVYGNWNKKYDFVKYIHLFRRTHAIAFTESSRNDLIVHGAIQPCISRVRSNSFPRTYAYLESCFQEQLNSFSMYVTFKVFGTFKRQPLLATRQETERVGVFEIFWNWNVENTSV